MDAFPLNSRPDLPVALGVFLDLIVSFIYQKPLFLPTVKCFTLAYRNEQIKMLKFPLKTKKKKKLVTNKWKH